MPIFPLVDVTYRDMRGVLTDLLSGRFYMVGHGS